MTQRKKRKPMPKWIWRLDDKILNYKHKHLLAYFWWCGDRGCQRWNYAIANRFNVSHRTIRRWIKALQDKHLIYINFPMKTTRTIYRRPYYSIQVWWMKSGQIKDISKKSQPAKIFTPEGTDLAYISNAQRKNTERRSILTPFPKRKIGDKAADLLFLPSNAGELTGSNSRGGVPLELNAWAKAKLEALNRPTESNGTKETAAPLDKVQEI